MKKIILRTIPFKDQKINIKLIIVFILMGFFSGLGLMLLSNQTEAGIVLSNLDLVVFLILSLVILALGFYVLHRSITKPVSLIGSYISNLSEGRLYNNVAYKSNDELGLIIQGLRRLDYNLSNASGFARCISQGDLDTEFQTMGQQDVLGQSLLAMSNNLKRVINETQEVAREAGVNGNLEVRIMSEDKEGAWQELAMAINQLLTALSRPIVTLNQVVNAMADGDLTLRYSEEAKGDVFNLAESLNLALDNLNSLLQQISESTNLIEESSEEMLYTSEEMNSSTREIASSISQMSTGSHTQVTKVDESSSLVESILQSAKAMGEKSETINHAAKKGVENSERGGQMVRNVVESISNISSYFHKTNESMKVLSDRSREITRVLNVITDIAAQTNLLALNAAIEAAQAGDAGRGFGVVAEEIRKLAEDSKRSAKEIEALILGVQSDTDETAKMIETMNTSVKASVDASNEVTLVFNEMTDSSRQTLAFSEEIVHSVKEQTNSIANVVSITEGIVVIAEQTAAGTEEVASSASELSAGMDNYVAKSKQLSEVAIKLSDWVDRFRLRKESVEAKKESAETKKENGEMKKESVGMNE